MPEPVTSYQIAVRGLWNTEHHFKSAGADVGVLHIRRTRGGVVVGGEWKPAKGELLELLLGPTGNLATSTRPVSLLVLALPTGAKVAVGLATSSRALLVGAAMAPLFVVLIVTNVGVGLACCSPAAIAPVLFSMGKSMAAPMALNPAPVPARMPDKNRLRFMMYSRPKILTASQGQPEFVLRRH